MAARRIRSKKHAQKRKEARLKKIKVYFVLSLFFCGILVGITHLNSVQINDIQIETDSYIKPEMIEDVTSVIIQRPILGIIQRDNILLFPRREIRQEIQSISSRIKTVNLRITGVQSFQITVVNREAVVLACHDQQSPLGKCYSVDENGLIFPSNESPSDKLLRYTTLVPPRPGMQLLSPHQFQALQSFIDVIHEMGINTTQVDLGPAEDVTLHTVSTAQNKEITEEVEIRINLYQELPQIASNLQSAINSQSFVAEEPDESGIDQPVSPFSLEYIDMRFENKVFYR